MNNILIKIKVFKIIIIILIRIRKLSHLFTKMPINRRTTTKNNYFSCTHHNQESKKRKNFNLQIISLAKSMNSNLNLLILQKILTKIKLIIHHNFLRLVVYINFIKNSKNNNNNNKFYYNKIIYQK